MGTDAPDHPREFAGESAEGTDDALVQVAYCHNTQVSHSWHVSMLDLMVYDGGQHIQSAPIRVACSGPFGLIEGRNTAARLFLDNSDADWLFWVDTDMGFKPDSLARLLAAADFAERPVVGGLCFAMQRTGQDGFGGFTVHPQPTIFGLTDRGYVNRSTFKPDSMVRVAGTGSAFIIIHRTVLEAVRERFGDVWYDPVTPAGGRPISEDLSFCWRVSKVGAPIYVHTGVETTHHKEIWLGRADYPMPDSDPVYGG